MLFPAESFFSFEKVPEGNLGQVWDEAVRSSLVYFLPSAPTNFSFYLPLICFLFFFLAPFRTSSVYLAEPAWLWDSLFLRYELDKGMRTVYPSPSCFHRRGAILNISDRQSHPHSLHHNCDHHHHYIYQIIKSSSSWYNSDGAFQNPGGKLNAEHSPV